MSSVDEAAVTAAAQETYGELVAEDVALVLARAKAEDVADQIDDAVVIGCDSVLDLDGEIHGKPSSPAVAIARWHQMRAAPASCTPVTGSSTPGPRPTAAPAPRSARPPRRRCTSPS